MIWNGSNTKELEALLANHCVSIEKDGTRLHLYGLGLNTFICEGDELCMDGDSLGIKRSKPAPKVDQYLTWTGENVMDFDDFLKLYGVNMAVMNERLNVYAGSELMCSLGRGDRITKRAGQVIVSRAGQHHRI